MTSTFTIVIGSIKVPPKKKKFLPLVGEKAYLFTSSQTLNTRNIYNCVQANK